MFSHLNQYDYFFSFAEFMVELLTVVEMFNVL